MGYLTKATIDGSDYKLASGLFGACTTPASTAAKVVTCTDFDSLDEGVTIHVKFTNAQSAANPTLNVNSTGAKSITGGGSWSAGSVCSFTYDGTNWIRNDGYFVDTKNTAGIDSSTSKMYLIGSTTAPTSGTNGTARTYSNSNVYATNGILFADAFNDIQLNKNQSVSGFTIHYGMSAINLSEDGIEIVYGLNAGTPRTGLGVSDGNVYTLGNACEKSVDTSIASGSTSTNLPTTAAVRAYVDQVAGAAAAGALVYQGTVGSGGDVTDLPAAHTKGWYYIVKTAGTYAGEKCEEGDMIICKRTDTVASDGDWDVIQANIQTLTTAEIDADWAAA